MRLTRETPVSRVSPCLSGAEDAVAAAVRQFRNPALKRRHGARFRAARTVFGSGGTNSARVAFGLRNLIQIRPLRAIIR